MDWGSLLTFATLGVGAAVDFTSGGKDADVSAEDDHLHDEDGFDDVATSPLDPLFDDVADEDDGYYAVAEFYPTIDPQTAILPWGDPEVDGDFDDSDFTLGLAA